MSEEKKKPLNLRELYNEMDERDMDNLLSTLRSRKKAQSGADSEPEQNKKEIEDGK